MRLLLLALLLSCALPAAAQDRETPGDAADVPRQRAIARALKYLAREQAVSGDWGTNASGRVGITALSVLAFLAQGHQENRGPYGAVVRKGIDYLLRQSLDADSRGRPKGFIYLQGDADSRMHGHGYGTQALVLAYGNLGGSTVGRQRSEELRQKIGLAVKVMEESQTVTGGWGYEPSDRSFHEGSVTVTVVQALRLARDGGFVVDKGVVDRGLKYLHESQKPDGSFLYRLNSENSSAALTAAAITAMRGFGEYYSRATREGVEYVYSEYRHPRYVPWLFYSNYYTAQAFYHAGGRYWRRWETLIAPSILDLQSGDGSWDDIDHGNTRAHHRKAFATAFSVLALSVPDGYLPTFQR